MNAQLNNAYYKKINSRFRKDGLENFDEEQALALLLQFETSPDNARNLASNLLYQFGGLRQVLEAPMEDLEFIPEVTARIATLIRLSLEIYRFALHGSAASAVTLNSVKLYSTYLKRCFIGQRNEVVYALYLDSQWKLLSCRKMAEGTVNIANVPFCRIIETALRTRAAIIVLAHNHLVRNLTPSPDDILTTKRLALTLQGIGVQLADHVIVTDDGYLSMVDSRYYSPYDNHIIA